MKTIFDVQISKFTTIEELPSAWTDQNYKDLLEVMEYKNISEIATSDLKEMCMMAITDNEPDESAKIVIDYIFNDKLNDGQKDNLSHEMIEEKMWEEYADLSFHESFFNAGQFLYQAYNGKFPHPEAVKFNITITGKNTNELAVFNDAAEATLLRLITNGMPSNTLINRLYKEQLEGETFNEAKNIIWQIKKLGTEGHSISFEIISSLYWFHDLKFVNGFKATTHQDEDLVED